MSIISTESIIKAIEYYKQKEYKLIDVPMTVDETVSNSTKPEYKRDLYHNDKVYIGSAEQSFIQLYNDGNIEDGKLMALTPCYRDEKYLDETHYLMFLKLELIAIGERYSVDDVYNDAIGFFGMHCETHTVLTDEAIESKDIEINKIEVGSYGKRFMFDGVPYIYGTGIAEPRFTYACSLLEK